MHCTYIHCTKRDQKLHISTMYKIKIQQWKKFLLLVRSSVFPGASSVVQPCKVSPHGLFPTGAPIQFWVGPIYTELGLAHLRALLVCKYLLFLGAKVGALFSHFRCISSQMGAQLGKKLDEVAFLSVLPALASLRISLAVQPSHLFFFPHDECLKFRLSS